MTIKNTSVGAWNEYILVVHRCHNEEDIFIYSSDINSNNTHRYYEMFSQSHYSRNSLKGKWGGGDKNEIAYTLHNHRSEAILSSSLKDNQGGITDNNH